MNVRVRRRIESIHRRPATSSPPMSASSRRRRTTPVRGAATGRAPRLHSVGACRTDRREPRVHQLDGPDRPGDRLVRGGRRSPGCGPRRPAASSPSPRPARSSSGSSPCSSDQALPVASSGLADPDRPGVRPAAPRSRLAAFCVLAARLRRRPRPRAVARRPRRRRARGRGGDARLRRPGLGRRHAARGAAPAPAGGPRRSRPAASSPR